MKFIKNFLQSMTLLSCLYIVTPLQAAPILKDSFNGWAIGVDLYEFILSHVDDGETIIELGSGYSTKALSNHFHIYSIEHDKGFLDTNRKFMSSGKYPVHFILAPIVKLKNNRKWYNPEILKNQLPKKSSLVYVDGPLGSIGRYSFLSYLHLFTNTKYILFDDVNRKDELKLLIDVAKKLDKPYQIFEVSKPFGVICL